MLHGGGGAALRWRGVDHRCHPAPYRGSIWLLSDPGILITDKVYFVLFYA